MREFPSVELFSEYFLKLNFINRRELNVECQAGEGHLETKPIKIGLGDI